MRKLQLLLASLLTLSLVAVPLLLLRRPCYLNWHASNHAHHDHVHHVHQQQHDWHGMRGIDETLTSEPTLMTSLQGADADEAVREAVVAAQSAANLTWDVEGKFDLDEAGRLWEKSVGCRRYLEKHQGVAKLFRGPPQTWPSNPNLQDINKPECSSLKMRHVIVHVADPKWLLRGTLDRIHVCPRCGITCEITWRDSDRSTADASLYIDSVMKDRTKPPRQRQPGNPLRVYLCVEPPKGDRPYNRSSGLWDVFVGYGPSSDVQYVYTDRVAEERLRQQFAARRKSQKVPLYRAVSHCVDWREQFARDLMASVPSHSVGLCWQNIGNQSELDLHPQCRRNGIPDPHFREYAHCQLSHYKFALVMENSIHPYYVSEKIFFAFEAGTLPIYYGTGDVYSVTPPHSFIDARKFPDIDTLAGYIKALHHDPVAYMEYFAWRRCGLYGHYTHALALGYGALPCRICEKVSEMGGRSYAQSL